MKRTDESKSNSIFDALLFLILFIISIGFLLHFGGYFSLTIDEMKYWHTRDDHMITQRVARNFFNYGVPYYNPSEAVAANTSLFWPILLSALYLLPETTVMPALVGLSAVMSVISILVASALIAPVPARVIFVVLISTSQPILLYGASGWEHVPQMLLTTSALYLIVVRSYERGILSIPAHSILLTSASFLIRPDAAILVTVMVAAWLMTEHRLRSARSYRFLTILLIFPIFYFFSMQFFYSDFRPNTYYLKVLDTAGRLRFGIEYILSVDKSGPVPIFAMMLAVLGWRCSGCRFIILAVFSHVAAIAWLGGDIFSDGRPLMPYFPILSALMVSRVIEIRSREPQIVYNIGFLLIAVLLLIKSINNAKSTQLLFESYRPEMQIIRVIHKVSENLEPSDGSIGLYWLGVGYHLPRFHIVDFLGKADPIIAHQAPKIGIIGHNKWDFDHSFSRYSIAAVPFLKGNENNFDTALAELNSKLNKMHYTFIEPELFGNPDAGFGLFVRQDLLRRFSID